MNLSLYAASVVLCLVSSALVVIKNMHMFQLNSYKTITHLKWMKKNYSKFWSQMLVLIICMLIFFMNDVTFFFIFSLVLFTFLNKPAKKFKKPLEYTGRVKRMFVVSTVLFLGFSLITFKLSNPYNFILIGLFYFISPIIPLISNLINKPIEKSIRLYYINDAKRILKECPNLLVIGITGSYGKTSVKYYLSTLLKSKYNVLMTPESFNTPMGIVKTVREQLRSTDEIFICEMGARNKGEIKELCDIVNPKHAIITAIGEQHLETFKSVDTIIKTKFELADTVKNKGILFLNGDNNFIRNNLPDQNYNTYGLDKKNDYYASDIKVTPDGTLFSLNYNGKKYENLQTQLIGEHNVINLVGAIGLCLYLGVSVDEIKPKLKKIAAPAHRLQLIKNNGMIIIDDAFNSNPSGCKAALNTLSLFDGYKILITPGMVELGSKQDECNYEFGTGAAKVCDIVFLVGEKQTKAIFNGLKDSGFDISKIFIVDKFNDAMKEVYSINLDKQKIVLIENDLPDNY